MKQEGGSFYSGRKHRENSASPSVSSGYVAKTHGGQFFKRMNISYVIQSRFLWHQFFPLLHCRNFLSELSPLSFLRTATSPPRCTRHFNLTSARRALPAQLVASKLAAADDARKKSKRSIARVTSRKSRLSWYVVGRLLVFSLRSISTVGPMLLINRSIAIGTACCDSRTPHPRPRLTWHRYHKRLISSSIASIVQEAFIGLFGGIAINGPR
ncbi:hypothetical protein BaRGS_00008453 [Batillaria attramentaria]|uniref:Uncharacterized protein n=1 Tax=Batillaria attramentaria TaxID=370345 RepID=A0ABD0LL75_9CAEN